MNNQLNIKYVVKKGLCISCGICEVVCPHKAIKMMYSDNRGMIFPFLNEKICKRCGVCIDVCYGFKVDQKLNFKVFQKLPISIVGNYTSSYVGFAKDQALRFSSTSGGVATALLIYALEERLIDGAIVTRMETSNPPRAKAYVATTIEEILTAIGSKYCPVSFAECLTILENDKRYAVIGLPCHIYGIRKLAEILPAIGKCIHLYLGIFCGGMPSYLGTEYLLKTYHMDKQPIKRLEYRGGGWPGRLLIQSDSLDQKKEVSVPYPEYWRGTFSYFQQHRCTVCHDGFNEFSDISCGDAWLPDLINKDKNGTSLIIVRTKIGERLLQNAFQKGYIQISKVKSRDIIKSQQGMIQYKNLTLKARLNLSKLLLKKLPIFDLSKIPSVNVISYLMALDLYIGHAMASNKSLWRLLDIYPSSIRTIGLARTKFKHLKKVNSY